jgi:hypothetical protein
MTYKKTQHRLIESHTYVRDANGHKYRVRKCRNGVKAADQIRKEVFPSFN